MIRVGINGFGRIGRCIFRALVEGNRSDVVITKINVGSGILENHFHLLKYDSTHGIFDNFSVHGNELHYPQGKAQVIACMDPADISWDGVDVVLECTGAFTSKAKASAHLKSAKKVVVSSPCEDADATIVFGVNEGLLSNEHQVISIGSCTTNCLALLAKVLHDAIGIERGFMTTVHAFTSDQMVLDGTHKDKRRARTCSSSMIPASTGAAKALGLVIPSLQGRLDGIAVRVPTANVSFIDLTFSAMRSTSVMEINNLMQKAAEDNRFLSYCQEELVSIDFNHNPFSCVFDATQTRVVEDKLCRVAAWYDNEWAFSNRMLDAASLIGSL